MYVGTSLPPGTFKIRADKKSEPKEKVAKNIGLIAGGTGMYTWSDDGKCRCQSSRDGIVKTFQWQVDLLGTSQIGP